MLHITNIFFIIIISYVALFFFRKSFILAQNKKNKLFYFSLFLIHYFSFFKNYYFSLEIKRDSYLFYLNALNAESILELDFLGSQFISVLIFPLVKTGFSFFSLSFLFSSISFLAFIRYGRYLLNKINLTNTASLWLILALFLTPSLHFWTSGLNKEAIIFSLMCVIFFKIKNIKTFSFSLILPFFLILLIRPYLFVILFFGLFLHFFLNKLKTIKGKCFTLIIFLTGISIGSIILKRFLFIDILSFDQIIKNFEIIVEYSKKNGGSSIALDSTTFLERIFMVIFRPLFFDAKNVFQYIISIENLIILVVLIKSTIDVIRYKVFFILIKNKIFIASTALLLIFFFSVYMYNLGLASRMRVMFMPYIYILVFSFYFKIKVKSCIEK